MIDIVLIMLTTAFIFVSGVNVGYRLKSGQKPTEMPKIEDIKEHIPLTKEYELNKKEQEEINLLNQKLHNINVYDGTSKSQVKIKK